MAPPRATFPPVITGSKWSTVLSAAWDKAVKRRGTSRNSQGTTAPRLSNGEAVALIRGFTDAAGKQRFPLWQQFAAVAYGWDGGESVDLDASESQGAALYLDEVDVMLWLTLRKLAEDLDGDQTRGRIGLDAVFGDVMYMAEVKAALVEDGAEAQLKIPVPVCKDKKTGRLRFPRPKRGGGRDEDCEPVILDPVGDAKRSVREFLILGALAWLVFRKKRRSRRD